MSRRRIHRRHYAMTPYTVGRYTTDRRLWRIIDRHGRTIGPPYASLAAALLAARALRAP
ncbi:MAG: hypothetical protein MUE48_00025 [Desulfobacterales bacterium]|jgi:hypothetical protein|nr:hypothetical protein [Desulfobacterales bacterium]